jgi:transposase
MTAAGYPSDLTDAEWGHVEPLIPPAKRGANRRHVRIDPPGYDAGKKIKG